MAIYMWREGPDYLCFTANTANTVIVLYKSASPTSIELETSTDLNTWNTYVADNDAITLTNIGDKVYIRNKSETPTGFSTSDSNYYYFYSTGSVAVSGDVNTLLCKNSTNTLTSNYCFYRLFYQCPITTAPKLPATTLTNYCYSNMFFYCTNLEELPELPANTLTTYCYYRMFNACSKIKLSNTQTGEYQTEYKIPITGTGTDATNALSEMFQGTGGTFTGTPTINTTYYTSNTVI